MNKSSELQGGQELTAIQQKDFNAGNLFDKIIQAVNTLAKNVGGAAVGQLLPPPPVNSIQVSGTQNGNTLTAPSELLHWTLTHNGEVGKNVHYFTEIDTSPNFTQPHVIHHGTSRSGFLHLPTQDSNGNTQTYYMRSYSQYPSSPPQKPTVLGGLAGATQIQMTPPTGTVIVGGTPYAVSLPSKTSLLPSTGSGTASADGTQGGKGLGTNLVRSAPTSKRSIL